MKRFLCNAAIWDEEGSALPSVLMVIIIISLVVGTVMAGMVVQARFIQRDIDHLQARYTAEGALFKFLATDSSLVTDRRLVTLPDSSSAVIRSERFGGFLKITSTVHTGARKKTVQVLAGKPAGPEFDYAVVLGDVHSSLNLAGEARVVGDILSGPLGVKESAFKGKVFGGTFDGHVLTDSVSPMPDYDDTFFRKELEKYRERAEHPPGNAEVLEPGRYSVSRLHRFNAAPVLYSRGDLEIFTTGEAELPDSLTVIATGNLALKGNIRYHPFTRFVSGKKMTIAGRVNGRHGLFVAEQILIGDEVNGSGQFLAGREISMADRSYLRYPSVLFLETRIEGNRRNGRIELAGGSVLDGTAILPLPVTTLADDEARIVIGNSARIRGGIYNTGQTELHGTISGSAIAFQFYFYESPTAYINWLKDNTIDVSQRPDRFAMPFGFSKEDGYAILDWKELVPEPPDGDLLLNNPEEK